MILLLGSPALLRADDSPSSQQAFAKQLGGKVQKFKMWTDDDGNVTGLVFINRINLKELTGPFPNVWRLVLDTPIDASQTMHFLRLCPNVRDLQLHRTSISAEQLAEIGNLMPELEVLWFKPRGGELLAKHLAALSSFKKLRIFNPQQFRNRLSYEAGWSTLAKLPQLQRLELSEAAIDTNRDSIERLRQVCSDLTIDSQLSRSRNYDGL